MDKIRKDIWFEGTNEIQCNISDLKSSLKDIGHHYAGLISLMPGMTNVSLIDQGTDFVTIKTNEGLMERTNISISSDDEKIVVEFDEEYRAGTTVTTNSHFVNEFNADGDKVIQHIVVSNLKAPGFMGFFYRNFGSANMGKAFLDSYKSYFEK